jgi:hypothetical protein
VILCIDIKLCNMHGHFVKIAKNVLKRSEFHFTLNVCLIHIDAMYIPSFVIFTLTIVSTKGDWGFDCVISFLAQNFGGTVHPLSSQPIEIRNEMVCLKCLMIASIF